MTPRLSNDIIPTAGGPLGVRPDKIAAVSGDRALVVGRSALNVDQRAAGTEPS